jgi:hypothetical protein
MRKSPRFAPGSLFGWVIDLAMVALAGWGIGANPAAPWGQQYFAPAMVVALSRLVPRLMEARWVHLLEDRALVALALAAAQASGQAGLALPGLALLLVIAGLAAPRGNRS